MNVFTDFKLVVTKLINLLKLVFRSSEMLSFIFKLYIMQSVPLDGIKVSDKRENIGGSPPPRALLDHITF